MATDVTSADAGPAPTAVTAQDKAASETARPHRLRFAIVYALLGAAVAAAIAGVVVYAGRSIAPGTSWSAWKPSGGGLGAAQQIAGHVSKTYRLPDGNQLVDVISKPPSVTPTSQSYPIRYVAVRGTKGTQDQIVEVSPSNSIMYSLCGLGPSCAIATGKPSVERGTLVRREILELALYTFKYVPGIDSVIAFMPPQPGLKPKYVVYLRKQDLAEQLKQPLAATLGRKVPLPKAIPAREVRAIDVATEPRVYTFSVSQTQAGDVVFVLAPLPA